MTEAIFYTVFAVFAVYGVYTAAKELVRLISKNTGRELDERGCGGCTLCAKVVHDAPMQDVPMREIPTEDTSAEDASHAADEAAPPTVGDD